MVVVAVNFNFFWHQVRQVFRGTTNVIKISEPQTKNFIMEPDTLVITTLGIKVPVVYVSEEGEKFFQEALAGGVVHYPGSALPGEVGNAYIFGHSSDYVWSKGKYKTVFASLPEIQMGDEIYVSDASGKGFIYKVRASFVAKADEVSLLSQETNGGKILTLQTSWPLGTALKRWIVRAEIEN